IDMINELVKYQDHYAKVLKYQSQQSKPLSKKQQREFYMSVLKSHSGWKTKHFKGMTLEEIREKFIPVWKQIKDFVPMASKEEGKRMKRKGLREDLIQLWTLVKKTLSIRHAKSEKEKELWVELKSGVQVVSVPPTAEVSTVGVPTGSGMVPTVSPIFITTSVVTPYLRRKGKEKMVESDTPKKKKLQKQIDVQVAREMEEQMDREDQRRNAQIARDAKIARIHAEEEPQMLIDGLDRNNEIIAKYFQEYEQFATDLSIGEKIDMINELVKYQDHYAKVLKYQSQQSKPLSKKQQREFYMSIEDFVPMDSKEERERMKRKGLRLEHESAKKIKTSKEVLEEDLKEMMQLVPVEEIIRLGGHTAVYQFFVDMLKHFDREDLNQLWTLVKETLSIRQATSDKEKELWVELKSEERIPLLSQRDATAEEVCTAEKLKERQLMKHRIQESLSYKRSP
nr:hypothetical protein [Tanacetum cinerariifolium]